MKTPDVFIQCLWQEEDTMQFVWQMIEPSTWKTSICRTKNWSWDKLLSKEQKIVELPNHFVHWSWKLRK